MSKPIKLNEETITTILAEIKNKLTKNLMFDGQLTLNEEYSYTVKHEAVVDFTPKAYHQMMALITAFDSEVGWHGHAVKTGTGKYLIQDILIYEQEVTGVTVDTDETAYTVWLHSRDDEDFKRIRFQGHSHVNMATSPSSTDLNNQRKIMQQLQAGDFYIFGIFNKKGDHNLKVFDFDDNVLYETSDITVTVDGQPDYLFDFLTEAFEKVQRKYNKYNKYGKGSKVNATKPVIVEEDDWYESYEKYGVL